MEQCYICGPSQVQFEDLANAIIIQAADDYRKARKKLYKNPDDFIAREALKEIEAFFISAEKGGKHEANLLQSKRCSLTTE